MPSVYFLITLSISIILTCTGIAMLLRHDDVIGVVLTVSGMATGVAGLIAEIQFQRYRHTAIMPIQIMITDMVSTE